MRVRVAKCLYKYVKCVFIMWQHILRQASCNVDDFVVFQQNLNNI